MIIFNDTSADFVLISVENDHNFEQNEDRATVNGHVNFWYLDV